MSAPSAPSSPSLQDRLYAEKDAYYNAIDADYKRQDDEEDYDEQMRLHADEWDDYKAEQDQIEFDRKVQLYGNEVYRNPLHDAIDDEDFDRVESAITRRFDITFTNGGRSALTAAAESGSLGSLEAIRSQITLLNINSTDDYDQTALMVAAKKGHLAMVRALLDIGADAAFTNGDGETALYYAAKKGHDDVVAALLEISEVDINAQTRWDKTPFIAAAEGAHLAVIRTLVAKKANVTIVDENKDTALHVFLRGRELIDDSIEILNMLLAAKVAVNAKNRAGETALMLAEDDTTATTLMASKADPFVKDTTGSTAKERRIKELKRVRESAQRVIMIGGAAEAFRLRSLIDTLHTGETWFGRRRRLAVLLRIPVQKEVRAKVAAAHASKRQRTAE